MRKTIIYLICSLSCSAVLAQPDQNTIDRVKKSMVKVFVTVNGQQRVGTGFIMSDPSVVVTALHVIAGHDQNPISVKYECDSTMALATVRSVLLEADLVALEVERNYVALQLAQAPLPPIAGEQAVIVGFPLDLDKSIETFAKVGYSNKKLDDMLAEQHRSEFRKSGYPSLSAKVIHIDGNITHGNSGGPVLNKNGEVFGIASGGIDKGVHGLNWAMPISYVPKLMLSSDSEPSQAPNTLMLAYEQEPVVEKRVTMVSKDQYVPKQTFDQTMYDFLLALYGSSIDDKTARDMASSLYTGYEISDYQDGAVNEPTLTYIKTRSLYEIYQTSDDQVNLYALISNITTYTYADPYSLEFDVYQDFYSGATVVVPAGMELTSEGDFAYGELQYGDVEFVCQVRWEASPEAATNQSNVFNATVAPADDYSYWGQDATWTYTTPYYRYDGCEIMRQGAYQYDLYGQPIAYGYETLATKGTTFMGVATKHENMTMNWPTEFSRAWAQAMIAVFLSTFEVQG